MFIKEAYEKRIQKEMSQQNEGDILHHTQAKYNKIGSVKNGKLNYDKDEQFFSQEDIPTRAKTIKEEVKNFIDPDLLGLRQKEWNNSVSVPKNPLQEETHERKLIKIKLGLFDHPIPKEKDNLIYVGTETRDDYTGWHVSTELDRKGLRRGLEEFTEKARFTNKQKEALIIRNYIRPLDQQMEITNKLRSQKSEERELREKIRKDFIFYNPTASKEKTDGAVFRLAYEAKMRNNQTKNLDSNITFKPDMARTLREQIEMKYVHNGVYEKARIKRKDDSMNENDRDTYAWSCCMSEDQNARGCIPIKIDKLRWNLTSFNS